jgi:hypothetical protein
MCSLNYTTNESLPQLISIAEILMFKSARALSSFVKLCLISVDVNQDIRATDGCLDVSLELTCQNTVGERQAFASKCETQLFLTLLLKLCQ